MLHPSDGAIGMRQSSSVAVYASSPEVVPATELTGEEESADELTTLHVWSVAEDKTKMKQCGN